MQIVRGVTWMMVAWAVLTAGCTRAQRANPTASPTVSPSPSVSAAPMAVDDLACAKDDDCVVSCFQPGDCCYELCDCRTVFSRRYLDSAEPAMRAKCQKEPVECPVADCNKPEDRVVPHCQAGHCVGTLVPIAE